MAQISQPPVDDYIKASILTAQGDIVQRGASDPERLAIGNISQILRVNAAGNAIEHSDEGKALKDSLIYDINASPINLAHGATADIFSIDLGTVVAGDVGIIFTHIDAILDRADAGIDISTLKSSGTGAIYFRGTNSTITHSVMNNSAVFNKSDNYSMYFTIQTSGTLIIKYRATSQNGVLTVSAGNMDTLVAWLYKQT